MNIEASNNIYAACSGLGLGLSDFTLLQETNDERFGFISFIQSKSASKVMIVKERFERNPSQKLEVLMRQAQQLNSSFLTIFDIIEDIKLRTLKVYIEYFPLDLSQQIAKNIEKRARFSQEELFAVLYSSLNGLACLENMHKPHGFITPSSLFRIRKQVYKLHDNFIIAEPKSLYAQALTGKYRKYLAPELVRDIVDKKQTPSAYDPFAADIFSLAMCILDAGLLGVHDDYIDMVTKQFDEQKLQDSVKLFGEIYPGPNFAILKQMLTLDLSKRPTASQLLEKVHNVAFSSNSFYGVSTASSSGQTNQKTLQKQAKKVSFVDYYTNKYDQAISMQINEINHRKIAPCIKNLKSDETDDRTTQFESPPRMSSHHLNFNSANPLPLTNYEQKFSTPPNYRSAKDSPVFGMEYSTQAKIDSTLTTPNKNCNTMECTPEKLSSNLNRQDPHSSELLPKKTPTVPVNQQYLLEKETALNRIIRESLERSEKNLEFIQELIHPPSCKDLMISKAFTSDPMKQNFAIKNQIASAEDFFDGIPLVMSTQASITPKHQPSSHIN